MIEPWVHGLDLHADDCSSRPDQGSITNESDNTLSDPDTPLLPMSGKNPTKKNRVGRAAVEFAQRVYICIRKDFADYLDDKDPDGVSLSQPRTTRR